MSLNVKTLDAVRERERERELYFNNIKCSIVQQSDANILCLVNTKKLVRKAKKQEKVNKVKKYKQERNLLKKIGFSSCFFAF